MLPFLEIKSVNQKSALKTKDKVGQDNGHHTEDSQGFAQLFNNLAQPIAKKDSIKKSLINPTKDDKLTPSKQSSNFLKILDEKYNLTKDFKPLKTSQLKSAKDLLEFSNTQKQSKTLKDLSEVAKSLQLNLKKISTQSEPKIQTENIESKNFIDPKIQTKITLEPKDHSKKTSLFNTILQDESFAIKETLNPKKTQETKKKLESKHTNSKEPTNLSDTKNDKKLESKNDSIVLDSKKNPKSNPKLDTKEQESKLEAPKTETKLESKINTTQETKENTNLKSAKLESQSLKDLQNQKEVEIQKPIKPEPMLKEKSDSKTKAENKPNITQMEFVAKNHREIKEPTNLSDTKNDKKLESKNDSIVLDSKKNPKSNPKLDTKEQESKLEAPKTETKLESKINTTQETKENTNLKSAKLESQSLKDLQNQKEVEIQKPIKPEPMLKEKSDSKTKAENKPNITQMEFVAKNHREINKDFISKNEKPRESREARQSVSNPFNIAQKEEIIQHSLEQTSKQESFLDNLLKTAPKPQGEVKEQQPTKEKEVRKESEKAHQENYQNSVQNQRESRFNPQTTFAHFSDRLRDAIANYRPPVTKISLELNPQNLGSVELTIAKNGDKLSVQISSNQSALQLIMQNTQEFKSALGNLGFQNVEIDFKDNQGNSLTNGNFNDSSGNQQNSQNGFQQGQQQNPQNFEQNTQQNQQETENWNENSLYIDKKAKNPYEKLAIVEFSFSYYA